MQTSPLIDAAHGVRAVAAVSLHPDSPRIAYSALQLAGQHEPVLLRLERRIPLGFGDVSCSAHGATSAAGVSEMSRIYFYARRSRLR